MLKLALCALLAAPVLTACGPSGASFLEAKGRAERAHELALAASMQTQALKNSAEREDGDGTRREAERTIADAEEALAEAETAEGLLYEAAAGGECDCNSGDAIEVEVGEPGSSTYVLLDACKTFVRTTDRDESVTVGIDKTDGKDCGEVAKLIDETRHLADAASEAGFACREVEDAEGSYEICLAEAGEAVAAGASVTRVRAGNIYVEVIDHSPEDDDDLEEWEDELPEDEGFDDEVEE